MTYPLEYIKIIDFCETGSINKHRIRDIGYLGDESKHSSFVVVLIVVRLPWELSL